MNSILLSVAESIESNVERFGDTLNRRPRTKVNEGDDGAYDIVGNVLMRGISTHVAVGDGLMLLRSCSVITGDDVGVMTLEFSSFETLILCQPVDT